MLLGLTFFDPPLPFAISLVANAALILGTVDHFWTREEAAIDEADGASLRLLFHGDLRHPTCLRAKNIGTWCAYYSPQAKLGGIAEDGTHTTLIETPKTWVIFIAYDKPTEVTQIVAALNAPGIPPYDIMISTKRACAVSFRHDIPAGELEIDVRVQST